MRMSHLYHQQEPDETIIPRRSPYLRVSPDALSLSELIGVVQASVAWWEERLHHDQDVDRDQAARAIQNLSHILNSLAEQLHQGRDIVRITRRLPSLRRYTLACARCGRGNRETARFCKACGAPLSDVSPHRATTPLTAASPAPLPTIKTASATHTGKNRPTNQDACQVTTLLSPHPTPMILLLVADGMGGAQAGEFASSIASHTAAHVLTQALQDSLPNTDEAWATLLRDIVHHVNHTIYTQAQTNPHYQGMGTTLTMLVVTHTRCHLAHIGDSRAYLININGVTDDGAQIVQISSDHSLVARLVDIGQLTPAEARTHPQRNVLYRALGVDPTADPDVLTQPIQQGDIVLCCSDGLTNHVEDSELAQVVLATNDPRIACHRLIALANQRGGWDNISVALGYVP